jgi:hypothetical protein
MNGRTKYRWKALAAHLPLVARDCWTNWRYARGRPRILIARHSGKRAYVFRDFLAWVRRELPELNSRLEFRRLPCTVRDWSRFALFAAWTGDTLDLWSPSAYRRTLRLQEQCRRRGIEVLNPAEQLLNCAKHRGAELMRKVGVRTPRSVPVTDVRSFRENLGGLYLPILIREDRGHGQPTVLIESLKQLNVVDWTRFRAPVAVEFIDVRDPINGWYRKYRYVAAGEVGVARHLLVNDAWEVRPERRIRSAELRAEELDYVSRPDPNHAALQAARRALGLDLVGFDYSYDRQGRLVVWEANPFLNLNYPSNRSAAHIADAVERSFAAVAHLYLHRAGLAIPGRLLGWLETSMRSTPRRAAA